MESNQNITIANPFAPVNTTWAICYLGAEGDKKNVLKLDNKELVLIKDGKSRQFEISEISGTYKGHKRLLLPLILGGIISPLSLIAIYENLFSPILVLTVFFSGLFLLYLGLAGSDTIVIKMPKGKEEYIFLRHIPEQVNKFISFINLFVTTKSKGNEGTYFYHIYTRTEDSETPDLTKPREGGYILLTPQEFENRHVTSNTHFDSVLINPLKLSYPIRLHKYADNSTWFTVNSVNPESIVSIDTTYDK